jgi:hypothetical protein
MAIKTKILKLLNTVLLVRDMPAGGNGSTALTAAVAAGATALTVGAITNFSAGDTIRIGQGEEMELGVISGAPAGSNITLADPLSYAHVIGEPVVEQVAYDLGDVSDSGVALAFSGQSTDIPVSTRRLSFSTVLGFLDMIADFGLPTLTMENLAFALGIPLTRISGAGTFNSPFAMTTDGNQFATEVNMSLIAIGTRMDGSTTRVELWGVDMDYTNLSFRLSRGAATTIPARAMASAGGVMTDNASAYVANLTKKAGKGKVFDYLSEVGLFIDTGAGVNSTSSGANAADQNVLNVVSGTGITAGMWLRVGTGDTIEFHRVTSVAVNAITLADNLFRAIPAGTVVFQQTLTPFAGLTPDGVTIAFGGAIDKINVATRRLTVGMKPGSARVLLSFALQDISLVNFAYALGISQASIVGGRLPLNNSIGTSTDIAGVYIKGVTKDGFTNWIIGWGCSEMVTNVAAALSNRGVASVPLALEPASGLQFMQHA